MRGKQGARAANRRDRAEVEQELNQAVVRAERAEKALIESEARHAREREATSREVAVLRAAAEEAVAPIVEEKARRIDALTAERDLAMEKLDAWMDARSKMDRALAITISENFSVRLNESIRLVEEVWSWCLSAFHPDVVDQREMFRQRGIPGSGKTIVQAVSDGRVNPEQAEVLARVRNGVRRNGQPQGEETTWGRLWIDDAWLSPAFDLGPLTRDVAAAAAGDD